MKKITINLIFPIILLFTIYLGITGKASWYTVILIFASLAKINTSTTLW